VNTTGLPRTVAVLGGGSMGTALVPALRRANLRVSTAWSRNPHPGPWRTGPLPRALREAELVVLAVSDAAIAGICAQLVEEKLVMPGQLVVHLAGALPISVLDPALRAGARTGSLHPLRAVIPSGPPDVLKGATAAISASDESARAQLFAVAHALSMTPLSVGDGRRALYHAAAVLAGGAQVALFAEAVRAFQLATGATEPEARAALLPLSQGALAALQGRTPAAAMTGPVLRADTDTIAAHLEALQDADPALRALYEALAQAALRLARTSERTSEEALASVAAALAAPVRPSGPQSSAAAATPARVAPVRAPEAVPAPSSAPSGPAKAARAARKPSPPPEPVPASRSSRPHPRPLKAARPAASSRSPAPRGRPPSPPPRAPAPRKRR
jgi:predicted short-subunit dehydrogenase-like oxidoreductase (DUF2520 family)